MRIGVSVQLRLPLVFKAPLPDGFSAKLWPKAVNANRAPPAVDDDGGVGIMEVPLEAIAQTFQVIFNFTE